MRCQATTLAVRDTKQSVFSSSVFAAGIGGAAEAANLLRSRDMVVYEGIADVNDTALPANVSKDERALGKKIARATERSSQRGADAAAIQLKDFIKGAQIPDDAVVCVVVWNPNHANDWQGAVRSFQCERMAGTTENAMTINQKLVGISFAEDDNMRDFFKVLLRDIGARKFR